MKKKTTTMLFILLFLTGLSLLLYPTLSNYWNGFHATEAVAAYRETEDSLSQTDSEALRSNARAYNAELAQGGQSCFINDTQRLRYESLLDIAGNGVMGYLEIPGIDVMLPIYHGTDESVLQTAAGHLEWTSLPVGGASSHCVLAGHRGLPSAKLFTDLDRLVVGDRFSITVLDETLTYEVDQILTVKPEEIDALTIQPGQDLCTLVTCTPYGINTHRLLVRGHRVENRIETTHIVSEAVQIEPVAVFPFVAIPLLLIAYWLLRQTDRKQIRSNAI